MAKTKLFYTILYAMLFLFALLLIIRMIRSEEGFQNQQDTQKPKPELYDLDLFFKNYPLQKICEIYNKGFPTVVNSFSIDEEAKKVPEEIAKKDARDYLLDTLSGGVALCPFSLPTNKSLQTSYDFVEKLDRNLLVKAMSTLYYFTGNLQLSAETTKAQLKKMEGFITECSAIELENRRIVPLQCIPADIMKATQQQEINAVDRFDMEQRVSMKSDISKKLAKLHSNLLAFQEEFFSFNDSDVEKYTPKYNKAKSEYDFWSSPAESLPFPYNTMSQERRDRKKMEWKADMDENKNKLDMALIYRKFARVPMKKLVETYYKLEKEIEGSADEIEQGISEAGKS